MCTEAVQGDVLREAGCRWTCLVPDEDVYEPESGVMGGKCMYVLCVCVGVVALSNVDALLGQSERGRDKEKAKEREREREGSLDEWSV